MTIRDRAQDACVQALPNARMIDVIERAHFVAKGGDAQLCSLALSGVRRAGETTGRQYTCDASSEPAPSASARSSGPL